MTPSTRRQPASAFCSSFRISVAIWTGPVNSWTRNRKASSRPAVIRSSTPRSVPTTTTAASTRLATRTPEENTAATRVCAPTWASRVSRTAASIRRWVRSPTPYARMVSAPTTASEIAPSMAPVRTRTAPYALLTRRCAGRRMSISGRKAAQTTSASGHEYTSISTVATPICSTETSSMMPPHCTNREIVSTSPVTRDAQVGAQRRVAAVFSSGVLVANLVLAAVVVVGTLLGVDDRITAGRLLAFLFLVQLFTGPVQMATEILNELQNALAGWRRVLGVIDTRAEITDPPGGGSPTSCGAGQVELRGVGFAYPDGPVVLDDVSIVVPARAKVAVVGATGSGKTTMARLIARLVDPLAGQVLLDGTDLRDLSLAHLRTRVVLVPQEGFLFDGTIAENVAYGLRGPTRQDGPEEVATEAFTELGLADWLADLPSRPTTDVGQRGERLSAGERQLVALARAHVAQTR